DPVARAEGAYAYPELRVTWRGDGPVPAAGRAYARISRPGTYASTVTRPDLYRDYLLEQLSLLEADYGAEFAVETSRQEIPYPYVLDGLDAAPDAGTAADLAHWFPRPDLAAIGD